MISSREVSAIKRHLPKEEDVDFKEGEPDVEEKKQQSEKVPVKVYESAIDKELDDIHRKLRRMNI